MAHAGKISSEHTHIEIDEHGVIWLIQNHFEGPTVIEEMESSEAGYGIIEEIDDFLEDTYSEEWQA